ncbi:MAG: hypothetical protein KA604_02055 [Candidatus Saccharimonas sp.]|nr:hypothetical protein [Candidatus Saccharimonas sp.]
MDIRTSQTRAQPQRAMSPVQMSAKRTRKPSWKQIAVALVTFALLALAAMWAMGKFAPVQVDAGKYQVVYLTNGQAYFGKLQNTTGEYLYMSTPYTAQSVAPDAGSDKTKPSETTTTLLRVKDQVYGPEDTIAIRASQVSFWQNLRDDSKVSQAIKTKQ